MDNMLNAILKKASLMGASDVYITVGIPPKMRVEGRLCEVGDYDAMTPQGVEKMFKSIATTKTNLALESNGSCNFSFSITNSGRYRVSAYYQRGSIALSFRTVSWIVPKAREIGVPESFISLCEKKRGLVLVTGPSGSGKSTTIASFINEINENRNCHVITIEDPIEFLHKHKTAIINQREIGIDSYSFIDAISDVSSENPDVVMIGKLEDDVTMSSVMTAAESGKLVVSSLYNPNVISSIEHIVDMFPMEMRHQILVRLSNSLEAVLSQQLVPSVEGGFVPAFELVCMDQQMRMFVREGNFEKLSNYIDNNKGASVFEMDDYLVELFIKGLIDRDVALSYSHNPEKMEKRV